MRQIFFLLMALIIFTASTASAQGKKILYVPLDSRPVNFYQVVKIAEKLGYEILTPPEEFLGTKNFHGAPDKLWTWLNETAPQADIAVISTDAMIYGSLVASRLQDLDPPKILGRAKRFKTFDEKFPHLPIYVFGTVMRTPRSEIASSLDPEYYKTYGTMFFNYTALLDKQEMHNKLSRKEQKQLKELEAQIPKEYFEDWSERREENFDANKYLIDLTREGVFEYFLLGCDDSAMFSQTHRESRKLTEYASDMGKTVVQVTSGTDELGMLMITRAINRDLDQRPFVSVMYNAGKGAETFPTYCNEPIGVSIDAAIIAAGGLKIPAHERADLIVAVNTRANGKTFDAASKKNDLKMRGDLKTFINPVKDFLLKGYPVAVADIAFANGADNALMNQLKHDDLQFKLRAYGGWNTATNTSGFLIGAGVLTKFMDERDVAELLTTRYLDDWAYQANVRQEIVGASYGLPGEGNPLDLKDKLPPLEKLLNERMRAFAAENLRLPSRWHLEDLRFNLPWKRTFECDPRFELAD